MDKSFEKKYSIEVSKLKAGKQKAHFLIEDDFFSHFEFTEIHKGKLTVDAEIDKFETHLDAVFRFSGYIVLECDRCLEEYNHALDVTDRVVFSYNPDLEHGTDEVVLIDRNDPFLMLSQEFYELITIEIPIRRIPEPEVHSCPPEILKILEEGEASVKGAINKDQEDEIDPRWEKLKDLKKKKG